MKIVKISWRAIMKHLSRVIVIFVLLTSILSVNKTVHAAQNITVKINGQVIYFDQYPMIENNRVLVPMRTIFEVMGADVEWDGKKSTVKAKRGATSILLPLNSKQATINGVTKNLDVPAKGIKGRTMVPLRFVSEALGCKVEWNSKLSVVSITFDGQVKEQTGKVYPDGWVAPLLRSAWSPDPATNFKILEDELGFKEGGHFFNIYGKTHAITVNGGDSVNEVTFKYYLWTDNALKQSYRIPIVTKELFKLYFEGDADRIWSYCNNNDVPEKFTANGRTVIVSYIEADGSLYFQVGKKK